jgi:hypothetical protein
VISDLIGDVAKTANEAVLDDAKKKADELQALLAGPERKPPEIKEDLAKFVRGVDLSTPDGGDKKVAATPSPGDKADGSSAVALGAQIEFIHFGRVHRDSRKTFGGTEDLVDDDVVDLVSVRDNRAIFYRAALEREAMLLAGFAKSVEAALAEKDQKEGGMGDLLTAAADLIGGNKAGGTANTAAAADMKPFVAKVDEAWTLINKPTVDYASIHDAGTKLHTVRANLFGYLHEQLDKGAKKQKEKLVDTLTGGDTGGPGGVLSKLPLVGDSMPIGGPVGSAIAFMQTITGKLFDVQTMMIFGLTIGMQETIESAAHAITLDALREKRSPIFRCWYEPPPGEAAADKPGLVDLQPGEMLEGNIADLVAKELTKTTNDINKKANEGAKPVTDIIDFLSKDVVPQPGHEFLDEAFQVALGAEGLFGGTEKLSKVAVAAFYAALTDKESMPEFMKGFVEDLLAYVFSVCIEFLRAVYRVLATLSDARPLSTAELVAAGSAHLLMHLIDYVIEKLGLDEIFDKLEFDMPKPPSLPGVNWPTGNKDGKLSAAPIIAKLKEMLVEKIRPAMDPVVEYAMSGLATRLNAQRAWATGTAMTMEVHLAQLPTELALMFRNLFGPLWELLTDTIMGAISDELKKVLGPASDALNMGESALGAASGFISDVQKKAQEAQAYAKNVEDKADALMKALSNPAISTDDPNGLDPIKNAGNALAQAIGADPFSSGGAAAAAQTATSMFPGNRKNSGKGVVITTAMYDEVKAKHQWEKATDPQAKDPPKDAAAAPADGAATTGGAP